MKLFSKKISLAAAPLAVGLITLAVFLPALSFDFVNWDDKLALTDNPHFRGLGVERLRWMFTTFHMGHYQPLTWLTFGIDHRIWGMNPMGYHLTNIVLHAVNAMIFYMVAFLLISPAVSPLSPLSPPSETGVRIAAGLAALFFAIHPLRVESVAWVTERRDLMSGLFFLLTILFYLRAAVAGPDPARRRWMAASLTV